MKNINVVDKDNKKIKDFKLNPEVFNQEVNKDVLRDAIILSQASKRQGTQSTKTRAEVSGGGRKPWRQKGTGRARAGSIRSNIWTGGGIAFGPKPRKYNKKQNRKEAFIALQSAVNARLEDMIIIDDIKLKTPKTKDFVEILNNLDIANEKVLVIVDELDENIILASRNLNKVNLIDASEINVLDLIDCSKILITEKAMKLVEEVLK